MSQTERTVIDRGEEPLASEPAPEPRRWKHLARRVRNEAGVHLLRGAATAAGGALVLYASTRLPLR